MFPESEHILIDGRDIQKWPNSMFYWINEIKDRNEKYFILLDEDCFLTNKEEIIKTLSLLDNYDYIGCPDGYHPLRNTNPIIINPFLLFGKVDNLNKIKYNMSNLRYKLKLKQGLIGWNVTADIKCKKEYKDNFKYPHKIIGPYSFIEDKEPYYFLFWHLLDIGMKFGYLYPYYDSDNISTNPKIDENSPEMAVHIWESRNMKSDNKLIGLTAKERFNRFLNLNI
jgi:hypothetical protein